MKPTTLLATGLAATLFIACSGRSGEHASGEASAPTATERAADIAAAFEGPGTRGGSALAALRGSWDVASIVADGSALRVRLSDSARRRGGRAAETALPARAGDPIVLGEEGGRCRAAVTLVGAAPVAAAVDGGLVVYDGAFPGGAWIARPDATGVEDAVLLAGGAPVVDYRVELVAGIAGLRAVGGVVELLDATGAPCLRVATPHVVARGGSVHEATVAIDGCAADASPVAPWGRTPVAPGSTTCTVRVAWDAAEVGWPALLDPAWQTAGSLSVGRRYHQQTRLADGRVLVTGGETPGFMLGKRTEVYDPATGTWAITGDLIDYRTFFALVTLDSGKALVVGGFDNGANKSELYDPASGTWSAGPFLNVLRRAFPAMKLTDGRVLVAGGYPGDVASAEVYDPAAGPIGAWTPTGSLATARSDFTLTLLSSGSVVAIGGYTTNALIAVASAERWSPATGQWTAAGTMAQARSSHAATRLADNRVLVTAGVGAGATNLKSAEIYDPVANAWSTTGMLTGVRYGHASALLPSGRVLVAGGTELGGFALTSSEVYDVASGSWSAAGWMAYPRGNVMATTLLDGRALIACGSWGGEGQSTAELFGELPNGATCSLGGECGSGHCVDAVCCATSCTGGCQACSAAKKGGGSSGTCGPIAAGTDPDGDCDDDGSPSCDDDGACDGAGSCEKYPVASGCTPSACSSGADCTSGHCVDGICCDTACTGTCQACTAALKTSGLDGVCGSAKAATDPHGDCTDDGSPSCDHDGACDGAGSCETYPVSSGCTPSPCSSGAECTSGHCVDGICCDAACNAGCEACTIAKKGAGQDGVCGPVAADTDPDGDCPVDPGFPGSCLADGACDGLGQCRPFAKSGVACGPTTCDLGSIEGFICNGGGSCIQSTASCSPYPCVGQQCATSCQTTNDCASGAFCTQTQVCAAQQIDGSPCGGGVECQSGFCADGRCCESACTGQCEACDVAPNEGKCVPVSGEPHGGKAACAGEGVCAGSCNGLDPGGCTYPTTTKACGDTCTDEAQVHSVCDGAGTCTSAAPEPCSPYVCGATACKTACDGDDDCAQGYACGAGATCIPKAVATCDGDHTLTLPDGQTSDCTPFRCAGTACKDTCATVDDCVAPNVCDASGQCTARASAGSDDGGCGCRAAGRSGEGSAATLGALLVALACARRRRLTSAPAPPRAARTARRP